MRTAVVAVLVFCALAPAARADGLETLQDLAAFHLRPAPLVPTTVPTPLSDLGATFQDASRSKRGGYGWRLVHYGSAGPDAVIALSRGEFASLPAALRDFRLRGDSKRSTRVRGRRGYVLSRRGRESALVWSEDGRVYTLATGTPRRVLVAALRATATSLDRLGSNYIGTYFQPGSNNTSLGAVLVATQRYVSGIVDFGTDNCVFNGFPAAAHGGSATFMMVPLEGRDFTIPLDGPLVTPAGWNGTLTGAVAPAAITLSLQGSGTFDETSCDTGVMSVSAAARDPA
jgi:hypothetical protein